MFKYDTYIGGAMHGRIVRTVLLERWLAKAFCKRYGVTYYDPADDENLDTLGMSSIIDIKPDIKRMKWYIEKDDKALDQCRSLLVLTGDRSSAGTGWEMGRMLYKNHKPIVVVSSKMWEGHLTNFTTFKASEVRPTIETAIQAVALRLRRNK